MTEKDFQAQIVELIGVLGGMVYHTHDSRRSAPGYPDLTIVTRGWAADLRRAEGGQTTAD